jgi:hypothetical protein
VNASFINGVRLMNGAVLDPTLFPKGLSFVTNMMVYITGNYNQTGPTQNVAPNWVSSLIASDSMTALSSSWDDANYPWPHQPTGPGPNGAVAPTTRIDTALLTGFSETPGTLLSGAGPAFHGSPAFLEDFRAFQTPTSPHNTYGITGSLVFGFNSVYRTGQITDIRGYSAPVRDWRFDNNFIYPFNQPPGTIVIPISATTNWVGR